MASENPGAAAGSAAELANVVYYLQIGLGEWKGEFQFKITGRKAFWTAAIGLKDRFLAASMVLVTRLFGAGKITSTLQDLPTEGDIGVVVNHVRIARFGVTLYLLDERYVLHSDGRQVHIQAKERFGPVPFLFRTEKEYPAEILDGGMRSVYYMPLLGAQWVARYTVRQDRNHIDSEMTCDWGEAREVIDRVA